MKCRIIVSALFALFCLTGCSKAPLAEYAAGSEELSLYTDKAVDSESAGKAVAVISDEKHELSGKQEETEGAINTSAVISDEKPEFCEQNAETEGVSSENKGGVAETPVLEKEAEIALPQEVAETTVPDKQTEPEIPAKNPIAIDKQTDERIRSDYAAYVSERDGISVSADDVWGVFNYGTDSGYRLLVMCPSETFTEDIQNIMLQCMDIPEEDCDCCPYLETDLSSGSFEMLAYKDGCFYPITEAINNKLVSYKAAWTICDSMDAYYWNHDNRCIYTVQ